MIVDTICHAIHTTGNATGTNYGFCYRTFLFHYLFSFRFVCLSVILCCMSVLSSSVYSARYLALYTVHYILALCTLHFALCTVSWFTTAMRITELVLYLFVVACSSLQCSSFS
eukprot:Lankesteria_metandrocarpae@DN3577_c0_g1_i2.p1